MNLKLKKLGFLALTLLLSLPWLTPCTFGIGTLGSGLVNVASRPLAAQPLDYLPNPDLKQWAMRPGPMLEVLSVGRIPDSLFVRDEELPKALAHVAPRPGTNLRGQAGNFVGMISNLLALSDLSTRTMLFDNGNGNELLAADTPSASSDNRRQLAISEFPFVLIQGENLLYQGEDKAPWPRMARADIRAKVTVITPDGTYFGIAQRIHFRSGSSEVLLEGNPTVQSAQQHIKGSRADAVMRLDFAKRRVLVSGPALVKKLFQ